jgi:hypothetical protein
LRSFKAKKPHLRALKNGGAYRSGLEATTTIYGKANYAIAVINGVR